MQSFSFFARKISLFKVCWMVLIFIFGLSSQALDKNLSIQEDHLTLVRQQIEKCSSNYDAKKWSNLGAQLQSLKNKIDEQEMTLRSELLYRVVEFESPTSGKRRLRFAQDRSNKGIYSYTLRIEKLDNQGGGKEIAIPVEHKRQPTQLIVSEYLLNQRVLTDEVLMVETKLNDQELSIRSVNGEIKDIEWRFHKSKKVLSCESREVNYICRCRN